MLGAEKWRVFVQDIGKAGYSGLSDVPANSAKDALTQFYAANPSCHIPHTKLLPLPHSRVDLWPNGKTGAVSLAALEYRVKGLETRGRGVGVGNFGEVETWLN